MVLRKHNQTAGFSLIEVLVAITILGLVVVPIGSSLVLSFRLNARSEDTLQAQLAVSSAVETIMAEGFTDIDDYNDRFDNIKVVEVTPNPSDAAHYITVSSTDVDSVSVTTFVRPVPADHKEGGENG